MKKSAGLILSDMLNNAYEYFLLLLREMAASGRATKINSCCRAMPYKWQEKRIEGKHRYCHSMRVFCVVVIRDRFSASLKICRKKRFFSFLVARSPSRTADDVKIFTTINSNWTKFIVSSSLMYIVDSPTTINYSRNLFTLNLLINFNSHSSRAKCIIKTNFSSLTYFPSVPRRLRRRRLETIR